MKIIRAERVLSIGEYSIAPVNSNYGDSVIALSFHNADGSLFGTTTFLKPFYTLSSSSTGVTLNTIINSLQELIPLGSSSSNFISAPACRITVLSGGPVRVRANVRRSDNVILSQVKDSCIVSAGELLAIGARHPISEEEDFVFTVDLNSNDGSSNFGIPIVTPGKYFRLESLNDWSWPERSPSAMRVGAKLIDKAAIGFTYRSGVNRDLEVPHPNSTTSTNWGGGLELDFGGGDIVRNLSSSEAFYVSRTPVASGGYNSVLGRHAAGIFNQGFLSLRIAPHFGLIPTEPGKALFKITVSDKPFQPYVVSNKASATGSVLNAFWFKGVGGTVNIKGYFADEDGFIFTERIVSQDGGSADYETKFIDGNVTSSTWTRLNLGGATIPYNAKVFIGRKTGDLYVIKVPADFNPNDLPTSSDSQTLASVNSYIDSSRNVFVVGGDGGVGSALGATSSAGVATGPAIGLNNIRVQAEGVSGAVVVIQSYNTAGLAVNRQTITVPTSAVTLSSLLVGYTSDWVAAKITSVTTANFFIIESDGSVAPGVGGQRIVIGDYSVNPIVINPELL